MEWISGEPPKDGKTYLGYFPQNGGYIARQDIVPIYWSEWGGGVWDNSTSGHHLNGEPAAWMFLPKPPNN